MIDGYLVYLGVIWAMALFYVLLRSKFRKLSLVVVTVLLIFSVDRIYKSHDFYTQRLEYLTETMNKHATPDQRKFIIHPKHFDWDTMWVPYLVSLESIMLSSVDDPKNATVLHVVEYEEDLQKEAKKKKMILGSMPHVSHKRLPKHYFDMPTEHEYVEIEEVAWRKQE